MDDSPSPARNENSDAGQPQRKPLTVLFVALAVVWFFPSLFALSLLKPEPRTGPGYFRNVFQTVATMDWFAWLLLAPAFIFAVLAGYFYLTEKSAPGARQMPNPETVE